MKRSVGRTGYSDAQMKDLLTIGFAADEPLDEGKKTGFIKDLPVKQITEISFHRMLIRQIQYIRTVSWGAAGLFLLAALMTVSNLKNDALWALAACTPFLALAAEWEVRRSYRYGMAEIESTTRFSLRSIVYARFLIVGAVYFAAMVLLAVILHHLGQGKTLFILSALLVPYLATMTGALLWERTIYGRSFPYTSLVIAGMTAGGVLLARYWNLMILQVRYEAWWEVAAAFLSICVIILFNGNMKMREAEIVWS